MGLLKKLAELFAPAQREDEYAYWVNVQCNRCGEKLSTRVDLRNDLSLNYGDDEGDATYFCRKVLVGTERCFQRIEVELTFDQKRRLLDRQISGGKFVEPSEDSAQE